MRGLMGMFTLGATLGCADTAATVSVPTPFRLRAPISNYRVPTSRPVLRWYTPRTDVEHTVTVCADRACTRVEETLVVRGSSAQPSRELSLGMHYWRVTSRWDDADRATPTWQFRTTWETDGSPRGADRGDAADYNGDGFSDIALLSDDPRVEILYGAEGAMNSGFVDPGASTAPGRTTTILGAADLDGDGFDDLALGVPGAARDQVVVFYGGAGGLSNERRADIPSGFPQGTWFVASTVKSPRRADLNQDGFDDLLLRAGPAPDGVNYTLGNAVLWHEGGALVVARPDGTRPTASPVFLLPGIPIDIGHDSIVDLLLGGAAIPDKHGVHLGLLYRGPLPPVDLMPFLPEETLRPFPASAVRTPLAVCDLQHDRIDDLLDERADRPGSARLTMYVNSDESTLTQVATGIDLVCVQGQDRERILFVDGATGALNRLSANDFGALRIGQISTTNAGEVDDGIVRTARRLRAGNLGMSPGPSIVFEADVRGETAVAMGVVGETSLTSGATVRRRGLREFFL